MHPTRLHFIKYGQKGYFGGYRQDTNRSFTCGFLDIMHANMVRNKIKYESYDLLHNHKKSICIMRVPTPTHQKLLKPLMKKKCIIESHPFMDAAFFAAVNNVDVLLINDVVEDNNFLILKNVFDIDLSIHSSLVNDKVISDLSGIKYDYKAVLDDLNASYEDMSDDGLIDY